VPNYTRAVQKYACADEHRPADIVHTNTTCIKDSYKQEDCIHEFHTLKMEAVGFSETWQLAASLRGVTDPRHCSSCRPVHTVMYKPTSVGYVMYSGADKSVDRPGRKQATSMSKSS
jgi:hypothetical protein